MVEGCKAPLGKHGPRLGRLTDSAPPPGKVSTDTALALNLEVKL